MAIYTATSPYYLTGISQFYLDVMIDRPVPKLPSDQIWTITQTYQYRPDLLAYDLYQNAGLWWVFYQRNPNTLAAPPLDFTAGRQIYLPNLNTLKSTLGF